MAAPNPHILQDQQDFIVLLTGVMGFTDCQRTVLIGDGYDTARSLVHWKFNEIRDWCDSMGKLSTQRGGVNYGDRRIRNLQALAWWCTDRYLHGLDMDIVAHFDADALEESTEESKLDYEKSKKDSDLDKPSKFSPDKWVEWEESIYNYLMDVKNSRGIPLAYVFRKDTPPTVMDREHEIIYNVTLTGAMFQCDSKKLLGLLKELAIGSNAETWIKGARCGRDAMMALQEYYDGESEGERRKQVARADLEKLFYRNESTFSFEKYVTKLQHIFNVLKQYKVPVYEEEQVNYLLDKINCPNDKIKREVSICRAQHKKFVPAATFMATAGARIFPNSNPSSGRYKGKGKQSINAFSKGDG